MNRSVCLWLRGATLRVWVHRRVKRPRVISEHDECLLAFFAFTWLFVHVGFIRNLWYKSLWLTWPTWLPTYPPSNCVAEFLKSFSHALYKSVIFSCYFLKYFYNNSISIGYNPYRVRPFIYPNLYCFHISSMYIWSVLYQYIYLL